jgi:phosphatidylglycerophosphatase A
MELFLVSTTHAQDMEKAKSLLTKVEHAIIDPLILLAFLVALIVFFWGIIKFINGLENPTQKEEGKRNMIWGLVGMTIMISAYGILNLISGTVGS